MKSMCEYCPRWCFNDCDFCDFCDCASLSEARPGCLLHLFLKSEGCPSFLGARPHVSQLVDPLVNEQLMAWLCFNWFPHFHWQPKISPHRVAPSSLVVGDLCRSSICSSIELVERPTLSSNQCHLFLFWFSLMFISYMFSVDFCMFILRSINVLNHHFPTSFSFQSWQPCRGSPLRGAKPFSLNRILRAFQDRRYPKKRSVMCAVANPSHIFQIRPKSKDAKGCSKGCQFNDSWSL